MNTPRPYEKNAAPVLCEPPAAPGGQTVTAPWPGECPAALPGRPVTAAVDALEKPELTLECWVRWPADRPRPPVREDICTLALGDLFRGELFLDENLYLCFTMGDGRQALEVRSGKPVADAVFGGQWQHLAVTARVMTGYFDTPGEAEINKLRRFNHVYLYCTRAGEPWPRLAGGAVDFMTPAIPTGQPGTLAVGGEGERRFRGALAQAVFFPVGKSENRFAALGLQAPADLAVSDDLPAGSGRDPALDPEGNIVVSGGERGGQIGGAYCFHFRVDGRPGPRRFVLETTPGSGGAASSAFISYDQREWRRIPEAFYELAPGYGLFEKGRSGRLRLAVAIERTPAWIATFIPFDLRHVDEAEAEFSGWDCFTAREIARTPRGRPIRAWEVTAPGGGPKRTVILHNGQHGPFETQHGHTITAMLRALREHPGARAFLREAAFLVFPVSNVDAAEDGGHAFLNRNARNLNRDWGRLTQPETRAVAACIDRWAAAGHRVELGFDFHSCHSRDSLIVPPGADMDAAAAGLARKQALLERLVEKKMGVPRRNRSESRLGTGESMRRFHERMINLFHVPCPAFELSLFAAFNPESGRLEPFGQHTLIERGPRLLAACLDYLREAGPPGQTGAGEDRS